MSKYIYVDKEVFEQKIKGWIERRTYVRSSDVLDILNDHLTEIDTDQSIEDRAEKAIYNEINKGNYELSDAKTEAYFNDGYLKGATEQDLISKAREKEIINELEKCFKDGRQECDGIYCIGCWKDIVRGVINQFTKK